MTNKKSIIVFVSFLVILFIYVRISHFYYLKKDFPRSITFVVAKKEVNEKGHCKLFDENKNKLSLRSYLFSDSQIYEGDSIVKKENSNIVFIYRKKNWRYETNDDSYFVAKKIILK